MLSIFRFCSLLLITMAAGCSIFPETKESLLASGRKSPEYCLTQERTLVEERVERYLTKCFQPSYVSPANGPGFATYNQVKKENASGHTEFSVFSPKGTGAGYFLNVLITDGPAGCPTTMMATAYNFAWALQFDKLNRSAAGEELSCAF